MNLLEYGTQAGTPYINFSLLVLSLTVHYATDNDSCFVLALLVWLGRPEGDSVGRPADQDDNISTVGGREPNTGVLRIKA